MLALRVEQVEGPLRGDEDQRGVFVHPLGPPVNRHPRLVEGMADMAVEFRVLVSGDVGPRSGPERGRLVDGFLGAVLDEDDRQRDMVRIGLHDAAQSGGLEERILAVADMQGHRGAAPRALGLADGELAEPFGSPAPRPVLAGAPAGHLDPIGDHEGGIEPDAELPDQRHVLSRVAGHLLQIGGGAGPRDGAEIADQPLAVHADPVIDHRYGPRLGVELDADPELGIVLDQPGLGERLVAQPVAGVGRVGDQLAQKDPLLAVQRVGDDSQQSGDFRLEAQLLLGHRFLPDRATRTAPGAARDRRRYAQAAPRVQAPPGWWVGLKSGACGRSLAGSASELVCGSAPLERRHLRFSMSGFGLKGLGFAGHAAPAFGVRRWRAGPPACGTGRRVVNESG